MTYTRSVYPAFLFFPFWYCIVSCIAGPISQWPTTKSSAGIQVTIAVLF